MCSNFEPAAGKQIEKIVNKQLELDFDHFAQRAYPGDYCPIIISSDQGMKVVSGQFGLSPHWAKAPVEYATYNARIETIEQKKTFAPAYKKSQFCLVPMQGFYEPFYVTGRSRWQLIYRADRSAFTIAGLYEFNTNFKVPTYSFTLLTHNADDEQFMSQFHRPNKEKRSIYLVKPNNRQKYLSANCQDVDQYLDPINVSNFTHIDA